MIFWGVGLGPGDPELMTFKAMRVLEEADVVFLPHSAEGRESVAGGILEGRLARETLPLHFPMTCDEERRDEQLYEELERLLPKWEGSASLALPVIGDSALYATAAYLYDALKRFRPDVALRLVPGVSAHSLAASVAGRFLALGREALTVIPGTAPLDRVAAMLAASDAAVIYKPSSLRENLQHLVHRNGPWRTMLRIDRAGLSDERIVEGEDALVSSREYLSVILLLRLR